MSRPNPYRLTKPCGDCPFREDKPFYLRQERAQEIAESLEGGGTFDCHKTIDYTDDGPEQTDRTVACAGALIVLERMEAPNQIMRIAERIGMYDPSKMDLDAPVFDSLDEWVDSMEGNP